MSLFDIEIDELLDEDDDQIPDTYGRRGRGGGGRGGRGSSSRAQHSMIRQRAAASQRNMPASGMGIPSGYESLSASHSVPAPEKDSDTAEEIADEVVKQMGFGAARGGAFTRHEWAAPGGASTEYGADDFDVLEDEEDYGRRGRSEGLRRGRGKRGSRSRRVSSTGRQPRFAPKRRRGPPSGYRDVVVVNVEDDDGVFEVSQPFEDEEFGAYGGCGGCGWASDTAPSNYWESARVGAGVATGVLGVFAIANLAMRVIK